VSVDATVTETEGTPVGSMYMYHIESHVKVVNINNQLLSVF